MKIKNITLVIMSVVFLITFFYFEGASKAFSLGTSYSKVTADGLSIFVMLSKHPSIDENIRDIQKREKALELRRKYKKSGLYSLKNPQKALWAVNWYSGKVSLSNNGSYLITDTKGAKFSTDNKIRKEAQVLTFYFKGEKIRIYKLKDLVKNYGALPKSISFLIWGCKSKIDIWAEQFTIITFDKQKHVFDITNGELLSTQMLDEIPCDPHFGAE